MSKYPIGEQRSSAVYDPAQESNPFLAALPEMMSHDTFMGAVRSLPPLPAGLGAMTHNQSKEE